MRPWVRNLALGALLFVLLLVLLEKWMVALSTLAFGWVSALQRIVGALAASPRSLAWAALALVLILVGTHWLAAWLWPALRGPVDAGAGGTVSRWPWRWTLMLHGGLAAVLFAAMSVTGVAHQAAWLAAAREPMWIPRERRSHGLSYMQQLATVLETVGPEVRWHVPTLRTQVWDNFGDPGDMRDRLHAVFLEDAQQRLVRALFFPRAPRSFELTGVGILEPGQPLRTVPFTELTNCLRTDRVIAPATGGRP